MVKACDHENFETLKTHPKVVPWKINNHVVVGLGFQMLCKVKIDFVEVP
jgi:hypothetical protein